MSGLQGTTLSGGGARGESEKLTARVTINQSTTRATLATPVSGKRIKPMSLNIDYEGTTLNGIEVYFAAGANIDTTAGKEIFDSHQAAQGPVFAIPNKPGLVDEVVSVRATVSLDEDVNVTLEYVNVL